MLTSLETQVLTLLTLSDPLLHRSLSFTGYLLQIFTVLQLHILLHRHTPSLDVERSLAHHGGGHPSYMRTM
jgi:hypothetical protein